MSTANTISLKEGDWPKLSLILRNLQNRFEFYVPRRVSQAAEPTDIAVGELLVWHDTANSKVYYMYNDETEGIVKVEMT